MRPYYEDDAVTIYHGDCREILPTLLPVDLVLTDPPYGINSPIGKHRRHRLTNDYLGGFQDTPGHDRGDQGATMPRLRETPRGEGRVRFGDRLLPVQDSQRG